MANLNNRINAFSQLGQFLSQFTTNGIEKKTHIANNSLFFDAFSEEIERAYQFNGWFTKENVLFACESWSKLLDESHLTQWTSSYKLQKGNPKTIAIIMAGNIPLVGFHDFLSVLIAGHNAIIKLSSNDKYLLPILAKYLANIDPSFKKMISFTNEKMEGFDAVIATGSNNTARYFDYYFGKYPNIIRKNRNSVAVLNGKESEQELQALADDIFIYFGLGCRSVSKIFVPKNYGFDALFNAIYHYKDIINNAKYANNYDYNKAVYLMSLFDLLENGFLILKEDASHSSPIASLFYTYYESEKSITKLLNADKEHLQCVVTNLDITHAIPFGKTQSPELNDYADGIDTLKFLTNL
jgi:hypothetical protein